MLRRLVVLYAVFGLPVVVFAADNAAAQDLLNVAAKQGRLLEDSPDPFVLDVDFTAQLKGPTPGHLRLRWKARNMWWSKVSMGGFEQVKFEVGERTWTLRNADFTPTQVSDLLSLLHVAAGFDRLSARKERRRTEQGVQVDCIEAEEAKSKSTHRDVCLDSITHDIVSDTRDFGYGAVHRDEYRDFADFAGHRYPRRLELLKNGNAVISATVTSLKEESLDMNLLTPPPGAIERRECADEQPPEQTSHVQPVFRNHTEGEVEFAVTILTDGTVGSIRMIRKSGGIEDDAVMAAIKNARYKPAMCGTDPVVADIIVGVRESY
jgi:TonB family protein